MNYNDALRDARMKFTKFIILLLQEMIRCGYHPILDEGMDRKTDKDPTSDHMKNSLHGLGLAQDILLWNDYMEYLDRTEHHGQFGEFWENLHPYCKWGGHFGDGNHYSFADPQLVGNRK